MKKFPAIFVSHGAPDLSLHPSAARTFLSQLGKWGKPQKILVISAHWSTLQPTVSKVKQPDTIHDFWGFDPQLQSLNYASPGAPKLADKVNHLLEQAGKKSSISNRGLDHGAWSPLKLMYPDADIPITQLSIQPHLSPKHHLQIGQALSSLREEGVLILASGSTTHNLREFGKYPLDAPAPDWVTEFSQWLSYSLQQRDIKALLNYRAIAPYAQKNHPTEEHLLPLFVALGAGKDRGEITELHNSYTYGVLNMAAYAFN